MTLGDGGSPPIGPFLMTADGVLGSDLTKQIGNRGPPAFSSLVTTIERTFSPHCQSLDGSMAVGGDVQRKEAINGFPLY